MRAWRGIVALLFAVVAGLAMLPQSSAQIPPPPTLPVFTRPTFTLPTTPPPTMPPPTTTPPPTMPPPTTTPPPTMPPPTTTPPPTMPPPTSTPPISSDIDKQIEDVINQLEQLGEGFDALIEDLRDLQSQF